RVLQTSRYRPVIHQALRFESAMFDGERRHWPELRPKSGSDAMAAWCHGAPGIGIARAVLAKSDDGRIAGAAADDLATALDVTMAAYADPDAVTVRNLSLCHGELGNVEAVSTAARALDSQTGRALADRMTYAVARTLEERGLVCGVP